MKIQSEDVGTNSKTDRSRMVMTTVYATMLTLGSSIMLASSPETVQALTANPMPGMGVSPQLLAVAGAAAVGILVALKFINKSIDNMLHEETIGANAHSGISSEQDLKREIEKHSSKDIKPPSKRSSL